MKITIERTLTTDKSSRLIPTLRFPEFENTGDWTAKVLGDKGSFLPSLSGKTAKDFDTGEAKFVPYLNVFSNAFTNPSELRSVSVGKSESQNPVHKGDVFFTVSSETQEEAGMSSVLLEEIEDCYLNSFCALFRFDEGKLPHLGFLGYFLRSPSVRTHLVRGAQGATRYNISKPIFRSVPFLLPSHPEQQKIANCLGSLDDLITAESRKLTALKKHKQGLMQQLFPQPGETTPRLRFSAFQNAPSWSDAPLGQLFETATGGTPDRSRSEYWDGTISWVTTSLVDFNIIESTSESISRNGLSNSSAKIFPRRTVLVAMYGQGKTRGKVAMLGIEAATNQACTAIFPSDEIDPRFVFLSLSGRYKKMRALSNSGGQKNLSQTLIRNISLSYPDDFAEQQAIIGCLFALDRQITAQAKKIMSLKHHKQGLMQRLFPTMESLGT